MDENGDRNADYSLLDMDPSTGLFQVYITDSQPPRVISLERGETTRGRFDNGDRFPIFY